MATKNDWGLRGSSKSLKAPSAPPKLSRHDLSSSAVSPAPLGNRLSEKATCQISAKKKKRRRKRETGLPTLRHTNPGPSGRPPEGPRGGIWSGGASFQAQVKQKRQVPSIHSHTQERGSPAALGGGTIMPRWTHAMCLVSLLLFFLSQGLSGICPIVTDLA